MKIPPELSYTIEYIKLLSHCGEGKNSTTEAIASEKLCIDDLIANLEMAEFCYPLKKALVYFMDSIYFEIEKDVTDDNVDKMKRVIEIISDDLEKFIEIEQRVKQAKGNMGGAKRALAMNEEENDDLEKIQVDINKNFNMSTAFGSIPIVELMEAYIFETVFPAVANFFELRLQIKPKETEFFKKLFLIIQKSVSFAKKE